MKIFINLMCDFIFDLRFQTMIDFIPSTFYRAITSCGYGSLDMYVKYSQQGVLYR